MHHRGVLVGRAVLDGCGVDFSGNGGHFFGLGTARQRLARAAYFTAIEVTRAAQPGSHSRGQVERVRFSWTSE